MPHMRFGDQTYTMSEGQLADAKKGIVTALSEGKPKILTFEHTRDGETYEDWLVYTAGVPVSFHGWDA